MAACWWWKYGDYPPGKHNLPHTGAVLTDYRRRRGLTCEGLAQILGVERRAVTYWEATMYLADPGRRIILAKVLKIPPALLGLAWEQVAYAEGGDRAERSYERLAEVVSAGRYYQWEDTLRVARELLYAGQVQAIAQRMGRWLREMRRQAREAPTGESEAWRWLLGHYLLLASSLARHRPAADGGCEAALAFCLELLGLAQDQEDPTLMGLAYYRLMDLYHERGEQQQARDAAEAGVRWAGRVGPALRGNLYLRAATVLAELGEADEEQWRRWQEEALKLAERVERGEGDASLLKLNRAAVHHERAKVLLGEGQRARGKEALSEAYRELAQARAGVTAQVGAWRMYLDVTEARLFQEQGELEQSAWQAVKAWKGAREMGSARVESELRELYASLSAQAPQSVSVQQLGVELRIF